MLFRDLISKVSLRGAQATKQSKKIASLPAVARNDTCLGSAPLEAIGQYGSNKRLLTGFTPLEAVGQFGSNKRLLTGFTLAEVILAAAILAFALAGLLALFISCMLLNESSRNRATAIGHAQFVLEEIKNTDFDNIESNISAGNWDWDQSEIAADGLPVLRNEAVDAAVSASGDPLGVLVTVSWQDRLGGTQSISLSSIFTDVY